MLRCNHIDLFYLVLCILTVFLYQKSFIEKEKISSFYIFEGLGKK